MKELRKSNFLKYDKIRLYYFENRKTTTGYNSTYKKLAAKWVNEALCFVSSSVVTDSFRLRNRQLLVAAKRYA